MTDTEDHFHEPEIKEGYAVTVHPVRWNPYKWQHVAATGKKGRWQAMNEYGGWENCPKPDKIYANFPQAIDSLPDSADK